MEALKTIPYIFLILAISGIIAGASMLTVSKFKTSMTECTGGGDYADSNGNLLNVTIQGSSTACVNPANYSALLGNTTSEYQSTLYVQDGLSTVSEQFPTIGIIAIMVIIISLIAGVFVYMKMFA